MVKIKFKDETIIEAELNGTSYIVDEKPDFPEDKSDIEILDENETVLSTIKHGQIIECASIDERYWFTIIEIPESDYEMAKQQAQILYTALMTDSILPE